MSRPLATWADRRPPIGPTTETTTLLPHAEGGGALMPFELPSQEVFEQAVPAAEVVPIEVLGNALAAFYRVGQDLANVDRTLATAPDDARLRAIRARLLTVDHSITAYLAAMVRDWLGVGEDAASSIRDGVVVYHFAADHPGYRRVDAGQHDEPGSFDLRSEELAVTLRIYDAVIPSSEARADFRLLLADRPDLLTQLRREGRSLAGIVWSSALVQHVRAEIQSRRRR